MLKSGVFVQKKIFFKTIFRFDRDDVFIRLFVCLYVLIITFSVVYEQ